MWDRLEARFGLRWVRASTLPHVTLAVGMGTDAARLQAALAGLARSTPRLEVELDGVAVFPGPQPIVYLRVVPNDELRSVQRDAAEAAIDAGMRLGEYFMPAAWTPHVTLAVRDLAAADLDDVLMELGTYSTSFPTTLGSLALLEVLPPVYPRHSYDLLGSGPAPDSTG